MSKPPVNADPRLLPDSADLAAGPVHGTCVALNGRGLLITGRSGSGKSGLAIQLIALGADLVSDDRVKLTQTEMGITASAPDTIKGLIEARGVGLLELPFVEMVPLCLVVDMDKTESERLPPKRTIAFGLHKLPLAYQSDCPHFAAALCLYLGHGRKE